MAKKKPASKKAPASKKTTTKKTSAAKTVKKPASSKKTAKKPATKKATTKKATTKKTVAKKTVTKKTTTKKATTKKTPTTKKPTSKDAPSKKTTKKAPAKEAPAKKPDAKADPKAAAKDDPKGANRKGITVVSKKPMRRSRPQPKREMPELGGGLLGPGAKPIKPLIQSGPNAPKSEFSELPGVADAKIGSGKKRKSPLKAADLKEFRERLLEKRRELIGDVASFERGVMQELEVDRGGSSDVAEQGSDAADQSLSLGLAEFERKLIREIDEALDRIEAGTYGVCEITGEPIKITRLKELPWTRYSIEGARLAERGVRR